jgi:Anti-sigma-K factor rskA, C-terminal
MTCEELRPDYPSYALGIASEPERSEIAEHLERQCPACVPGVASALATVTAISGAVKITEPPKNLRRRVIASVERVPKHSWTGVYLPWAVTAALSLALLGIGISGRRQIGDTEKLRRALSIIDDPAAKDVSFGEDRKPSRGRVFVSPGQGVVFIGANLPRIDSGKTFELWLLPPKGNPVPAGVFDSQPDATAVFVRPGAVTNTAEIAVTIEPEGGSPQPTTTPIIVAKL